MAPWSKATLAFAGVVFGVALLAGSTMGGLPWWLLAASIVLHLRFWREAHLLFRWSRNPLARPEQNDPAWKTLATRLHVRLHRERNRMRELTEQARGLRAVTRSLPDAAIIVDDADDIVSYNPAAETLLQLRQADLGKSLTALVRHPDFIALLKGKAKEDSVELLSPFVDGQRLEARWLPVAANRSLVVVRDITELTTLLTMRQDFIANVSHELRTPLTVVKGYLEALADGDLEPEVLKTIVERLQSPTQRMQALVDDLLLLTRLESAPDISEQDRAVIDMERIIEAVRREVQLLQQDNQALQVAIESPVAVYGIESEIYSAVLNLVTNALRYSPDGGVITVRWTTPTAAPGAPKAEFAELQVEDQGVGIAKEHINRITERFYRVDMATARVRGGTGLGLAIVKHVLKRHGATLIVESEIGVGSTFSCRFPDEVLVPQSHPALAEAP
ncbi:MAG: phosphate regulon sensor histidine kinase PhoR [Pseudomonadota bacterium]